MKIRESGMPQETQWSQYFDPEAILKRLCVDQSVGDVVDFGSGYGTFAVPAAKAISGTVYALDVESEMARAVEQKTKEQKLANLKVILRDFVSEGSGLSESSVDVKAMYSHGSLRDRALLLVLSQSGFSEVDVSCFRIEELKGLYENPETEHYFIEKPREKTNEIQATCLSYEAVHDLKAMLQERGNPESGFLFVSQTKGKGEQLEVRSINEAMKALAQKTFSPEKAKEFKTKALRSFYNSALLRAGVSPQELKDLMFGHGRKGARGHYDYDELTIREAYVKVFEHVSINGLQVRADLKKVMDTLKGLTDTNVIFQRQLDAKDRELEEVKSELKAVSNMIKAMANSDAYKEMNAVMEQVADKLAKDPKFAEQVKADAEKLKASGLKSKLKGTSQ